MVIPTLNLGLIIKVSKGYIGYNLVSGMMVKILYKNSSGLEFKLQYLRSNVSKIMIYKGRFGNLQSTLYTWCDKILKRVKVIRK